MEQAARLTFRAYGVAIGIQVDDPTLLEQLPPHLPHGWKQVQHARVDRLYSLVRECESDRTSSWALYRDNDECGRTTDLDDMLEVGLETELRLTVAELAPQRIFVHAGVVGWGNSAIVIPGRTHVGKTTLVAALVRAGATFYSDEFAVLDGRGRVHPFAAPLQLREGINQRQRKYEVQELGGRSGHKPLRVGLVIAARYESGARWRPRQLSAGQGVLELLDNTVAARSRPEQALSALEQAVSHALVLKGVRGEAEAVAGSLLGVLTPGVSSRAVRYGELAWRPEAEDHKRQVTNSSMSDTLVTD